MYFTYLWWPRWGVSSVIIIQHHHYKDTALPLCGFHPLAQRPSVVTELCVKSSHFSPASGGQTWPGSSLSWAHIWHRKWVTLQSCIFSVIVVLYPSLRWTFSPSDPGCYLLLLCSRSWTLGMNAHHIKLSSGSSICCKQLVEWRQHGGHVSWVRSIHSLLRLSLKWRWLDHKAAVC
jgi:hypothetical protein